LSDDAAALALRLRAVAGEDAALEARWMLEDAGGDSDLLESFVAKRLSGMPLDRVLGHRGFWTLDLLVTPDTLAPRPDSETIIRAACDHLKRPKIDDWPLRVLDLGTGTGALLLALLAEFPSASGIGVDLSVAALDVARANARRNGLADRAQFIAGDWATGIDERFDAILSNPPYIPKAEIAALDAAVRDHDPHLALDGGADGLEAYRAILGDAGRVLKPKGLLVLELGIGQAEDVAQLAAAAGLSLLEIRRDLGGIERAMVLAVA
jgi:release factor glutamine methyltransferase